MTATATLPARHGGCSPGLFGVSARNNSRNETTVDHRTHEGMHVTHKAPGCFVTTSLKKTWVVPNVSAAPFESVPLVAERQREVGDSAEEDDARIRREI